MKNEKRVTHTGLKEKKGGSENITNRRNTKKGKNGVLDSNVVTSAVGKTKARSGSGLANEGTVVSYDEER